MRVIEQCDVPVALAAGRADSARRRSPRRHSARLAKLAASAALQSPHSPRRGAARRASKPSRRAGSARTSTASPAAFGANTKRTLLKLTSRASGPTLYGLSGSASNAAGSCVAGAKYAAIEHEIAADGRQSGGAQPAHQFLKLLDRDLRVAVSFEHQVAVEHAVDHAAVGIGLGAPAVVGAEQLERRRRSSRSFIVEAGFIGLVGCCENIGCTAPISCTNALTALSGMCWSRNARATARGSPQTALPQISRLPLRARAQGLQTRLMRRWCAEVRRGEVERHRVADRLHPRMYTCANGRRLPRAGGEQTPVRRPCLPMDDKTTLALTRRAARQYKEWTHGDDP